MAALLLSVAGAAAGGAVFGPVGAIAGRIVGALAGNVIDHALLASNTARAVEGPRLSDLDVMASTEGAPIPRLYGRARLSGQVIWATRLEEVVSRRPPIAVSPMWCSSGWRLKISATGFRSSPSRSCARSAASSR